MRRRLLADRSVAVSPALWWLVVSVVAVVGPFTPTAVRSTAAAEPSRDVIGGLTGEPWVDMDYGPSLTLTLEAGEGNFAYKGLAVRLDEGPGGISKGSEFAVFDTDTLRYAASWIGPQFIDWHCIHFDGQHAVHPRPVGSMLFENPPGPGWAEPGTQRFEDARLVGRDGRRYGPLARDWARWNGHYHHGDRVVLSYTVGDTEILEMPSSIDGGDLRGFVRTLNVGPRRQELVVQVAHHPSAAVKVSSRDGYDYVTLNEKKVATPAEGSAETAGRSAQGLQTGMISEGGTAAIVEDSDTFDLADKDFTVWGIIETRTGGTIFAKAPAEGRWAPGAKALFIRGGQLAYDVGWVGVVETRLDEPINDGEPHEVALTFSHNSNTVKLYVDGELAAENDLGTGSARGERVVKLGFASPDFPARQSSFVGRIAELRFYDRALEGSEIAALRRSDDHLRGLVAQWDRVEGDRFVDRTAKHDARLVSVTEVTAEGRGGRGLGSAGPELGGILCVGRVGGPTGCEWITTENGDVRLRIPAGQESARLKIVYARLGSDEQLSAFEPLLSRSAPPQDLAPLTRGGPQKWTEAVTTRPAVVTETDGPYIAEAITVPHDNPYRSWMRLGGFDFFEDGGRAAVCTWQGDVWIVDGIGGDLDKDSVLRWRRIASGLFQPLGLKVVGGDIYVLCRDQITVLRDLNGDGETDFYENFNNDHQVTDHFHEFAVGLETDAEGNFYYAKCARHALDAVVPQHGTLLKVSPDGSTTEILARGYRAPNGVCVNEDGTFFLSDQEGHWTPKNRINWVKPGGFYGNMMAYHEGRDAADFEPPVCWIHNDYDRSPAEQVRVTSTSWGPLEGSLLSLSYGTGEIHLVLHEQVGDMMQGGLVRLPVTGFPTGIIRGRFHPGDGQLYGCGLFGWSSNKTSPGGFYRIRYTGRPLHMPREMYASREGLSITFTEPLDEASAVDVENWSATRWQYRRTQNYGSEDYRLGTPLRRGRDRLQVEAVELGEDRRTVHLKLRDMQPAMQMEVRYDIRAADGTEVSQLIHHTVHALGTAAPERLEQSVAQRLQPGLAVELRQAADEIQDARTARQVALLVRAGESPTPLLSPGSFTATFRGYFSPKLSGRYTFHLTGRGQATLRIDGREVLRGAGDLTAAGPATVELSTGYTPIEVAYASTEDGVGDLRLFWEGRKEDFREEDAFAVEPLPPAALWHNPHAPALTESSRLRRGRELFANLNCIRCHSLNGVSPEMEPRMPELARRNPDLAGAGQRLTREWLLHWIADPAAVRNDVTMPQVFGSTLDEAEQQELADLVAYLAPGSGDPVDQEGPTAEGAEVIRSGELLYEDLGCIACHRLTSPAAEDPYARISLHAADAKYRPGALSAFLQAPHADYPHSRMPDFRLSVEEAAALAAFVRARGSWKAAEQIDPGDPTAGERVFRTRGCAACHESSGELNSPAPLQPIPLRARGSSQKGCLADTEAERGGAPHYSLTAEQLEALRAFLVSSEHAAASLQKYVPVEASQRLVSQLRCHACHERDGRFSVLSEILLEEGVQGLPPGAIPSLTWTGEKLQRDWTRKLLAGEIDYRARPWLKTRMPAFGVHFAQPIATGLPREHGYSGTLRSRPEHDEQLAAVGEKLTQQFGGFYCTECHSAGGRPPTSAFDHRGIDFPYVTERLQYDYYHRWMRNPQRIDPGTKMPQFSKQPIPAVLEGNATMQFDALWHYLRSLEE